MCASCGCGSEAKTTILNLETGTKSTLDDPGGHEHVLPDGTRVWHSHSHDHDHEHGHDHGHAHDHDRHHGDHGHGHHHDHAHDNGAHHADHHGHSHHHDHAHAHGHAPDHGRVVDLEARILAKNDDRAARNRAWFAGREILALNLMSAPGAGKTTLLERTIRELGKDQRLFVIEGDQATANDGERIRAAGAPVVQVNTGTGCHLDADMIARGLDELKPPIGALVIIENVGNLVCPALFDLGETARVAILSVTEGDDKPIKYPHMFRGADLVLVNKIDLLPHVDFSVERATAYAREVHPSVEVLTVSARTGDGLAGWFGWIAKLRASALASARV